MEDDDFGQTNPNRRFVGSAGAGPPGESHRIPLVGFVLHPEQGFYHLWIDHREIDPLLTQYVVIQDIVIGCAFDQHEFDLLRTEPFGCLESVCSMLTELSSFEIVSNSLINGGNDDILVSITSARNAEARLNLRLPISSYTPGYRDRLFLP